MTGRQVIAIGLPSEENSLPSLGGVGIKAPPSQRLQALKLKHTSTKLAPAGYSEGSAFCVAKRSSRSLARNISIASLSSSEFSTS